MWIPSSNTQPLSKYALRPSLRCSYVYIAPLCMRKPRLVAMSRLPSRARSKRSARISFWRLLTPLEETFAWPVALSSMKKHLLHRAMPKVACFSSLNRPGSRLLHLSQASQRFLSSSNWTSYPGRTASSSFSWENAKYMLSVSI